MGNVVSWQCLRTTKTWPASQLNVTWMIYIFVFRVIDKTIETTKPELFLLAKKLKGSHFNSDAQTKKIPPTFYTGDL